MTVFVDTSALYAVLDEDDINHEAASTIWRDLLESESFVTHAYVEVEASALVHRRLGVQAVRQLLDGLLAPVAVEMVDRETHSAAVQRWRAESRHRRAVSLVDATSFVVMERDAIDRVFVFDRDFVRAGFSPLS